MLFPKNKQMKATLIVLLYLIFAVSAHTQVILPFGADIKNSEAHFNEFICVQPADSVICELENNVYLSYDNDFLYINWDAEIYGNTDLGRFTSRERLISSNYIKVQIITDVNSYFAYGFIAFPSENKYDFIRNPSLTTDSKWNCSYDYTSEVNGNSWQVMMKIPFKDLRFSGEAPYDWKIILSRYFPHSEETYSNAYLTTKMGKDYFRKATDICIPTNISRNKNFYLRPYMILSNDFKENDFKFDVNNTGLDFSFNPGFSTKLKLSINPDFSDIPLDTESDTYNMKYAPRLSENRYFFIEDFNAFGVTSDLFYSRKIVQPSYALKFTGNSENYSFGFLSSQDAGNKEDFGKNLNTNLYNILAFKPFTKDFSFQFTFLSKTDSLEMENSKLVSTNHNEVLHFKPAWDISSNTSVSTTVNLSSKTTTESTDYGYYCNAKYSFREDDTSLTANVMKMGQGYAADMGKLYETDFYGWTLYASKSLEIESETVKKIYTNAYLSEEMDNISNILLERILSGFVEVDLQQHFDFSLYYKTIREYFLEQHFTERIISESISWDKYDWLKISYSISQGKELDYYYHKVYDVNFQYIEFEGDIGKHISYSSEFNKTKYLDYPDDIWSDDEYWIGNFDLSVNVSNKISVTNGVRFNNYEIGEYSDHYGFFSNFSWEYKENSFLYFGYKTVEDKISDSFISDYKSAYLKLSYTF